MGSILVSALSLKKNLEIGTRFCKLFILSYRQVYTWDCSMPYLWQVFWEFLSLLTHNTVCFSTHWLQNDFWTSIKFCMLHHIIKILLGIVSPYFLDRFSEGYRPPLPLVCLFWTDNIKKNLLISRSFYIYSLTLTSLHV